MKPSSIITTVCATLIACGTAYWIDAREPARRQPYPKATPPPPASNLFTESKEPAPSEQEIETIARERSAVLQAEIERALAGHDRQQLEAVFTFLPELLQVDPARVVAMYERAAPGKSRDQLRGEIARQWIGRDPHAAISWMESLEQEAERRAAAREAVDVLVPTDLRLASAVAERFKIGGSLEPDSAR